MLNYHAIPTDLARAYQAGGCDAYGNPPERARSDGGGNPCRHCLRYIPKGADMLVLAHRPFPQTQPYAETGPVFLCADDCSAPQTTGALPKSWKARQTYCSVDMGQMIGSCMARVRSWPVRLSNQRPKKF